MPNQNQKNEQTISDLQQQTGELSALNSLFSEIINAFPYNVVVIDFDYNILNCNHSLKETLANHVKNVTEAGSVYVPEKDFSMVSDADWQDIRNTYLELLVKNDFNNFVNWLKSQ